jgi:hypothetical protein
VRHSRHCPRRRNPVKDQRKGEQGFEKESDHRRTKTTTDQYRFHNAQEMPMKAPISLDDSIRELNYAISIHSS